MMSQDFYKLPLMSLRCRRVGTNKYQLTYLLFIKLFLIAAKTKCNIRLQDRRQPVGSGPAERAPVFEATELCRLSWPSCRVAWPKLRNTLEQVAASFSSRKQGFRPVGVTYHMLSRLLIASIDVAYLPLRQSQAKKKFSLFYPNSFTLPFNFISELNSSGLAASCCLRARDVIVKICPRAIQPGK